MTGADIVGTLTSSIGSDALSAVVAALGTAGIGVARSVVTRRMPARRTFRFTSGSDLMTVVASSALIDTGTYHRPATGIGQVRAMSILSPVLARGYRDVDLERVRLSTEVGGTDLANDLLVLGGPKSNQVADVLLKRLAPRLSFTVEGTIIKWAGRDYDGSATGGAVDHDFGYVVRASHPMHPHRRVVIVAGSHTYGTIAAARWLADQGGSHRLPADVSTLVETEVVWGHVGTPRVIRQETVRALAHESGGAVPGSQDRQPG